MHTEKITIDKLKIKYKNFLESIYNISLHQEIFSFVTKNVHHFFQVIILGLGCYYVIINILSLGQLIVYQSILGFLNNSINNFVDLIYEYSNYKI